MFTLRLDFEDSHSRTKQPEAFGGGIKTCVRDLWFSNQCPGDVRRLWQPPAAPPRRPFWPRDLPGRSSDGSPTAVPVRFTHVRLLYYRCDHFRVTGAWSEQRASDLWPLLKVAVDWNNPEYLDEVRIKGCGDPEIKCFHRFLVSNQIFAPLQTSLHSTAADVNWNEKKKKPSSGCNYNMWLFTLSYFTFRGCRLEKMCCNH